MSSSPPTLVAQRRRLQDLRDEHDHRESVSTTIRMVRSVLEERARRLDRSGEHARTDEDILGYVEDFLDVHAGSGPDLGFLSSALSQFLTGFGSSHDHYGPLDPPDQTLDPFPEELHAYISGSGSHGDAQAAARAVVESDVQNKVASLAWFFDEHLHPIAADEIDEIRQDIESERASHVDELESDDSPGGDSALEVLGWDEPVAMLPVRVETSFSGAQPQGGQLHVRVYPDEIHVDSHETELTEAEHEWATIFWAQVWFAYHDMPSPDVETRAAAVYDGAPPDAGMGPDRLPNDRLRREVATLHAQIQEAAFSREPQERFEEIRDRAWQRGVERFGTERAAYVVHALSPEQGGSSFGDRLLEGPAGGHWVERPDEFRELTESEQVQSFLLLDSSDQRWVIRQLEGEDALEDVNGTSDRLHLLGEALAAATERRRLTLLFTLLWQGKLDRYELEWIRDLLQDADDVRHPPDLRFPDVDFRPASWSPPMLKTSTIS